MQPGIILSGGGFGSEHVMGRHRRTSFSNHNIILIFMVAALL
jgi:hypothetical protein